MTENVDPAGWTDEMAT